ncbi:hypothetical protein GPECTOR_5g189 [Gonium pectorale]|uniref:Uncharacterized protein n=1 Tax=Gonium pectorale TaxID=33097 RepID=A0A150GWD9_GONPE|nr:hypothetical protein GPECTOR_5g189 [Gonium pectorale]|eukprot:KXZ54083.1 hypothetical protein GPECTOR_5g189 [Gonium pectorale]
MQRVFLSDASDHEAEVPNPFGDCDVPPSHDVGPAVALDRRGPQPPHSQGKQHGGGGAAAAARAPQPPLPPQQRKGPAAALAAAAVMSARRRAARGAQPAVTPFQRHATTTITAAAGGAGAAARSPTANQRGPRDGWLSRRGLAALAAVLLAAAVAATLEWRESAAVRVLTVTSGSPSPYRTSWDELAGHSAQRLEWTDPSFQMLVFRQEQLAGDEGARDAFLRALSGGPHMLVGLDVTDAAAEALMRHPAVISVRHSQAIANGPWKAQERAGFVA